MENNSDGHTHDHGECENLCMMCRMNEKMHGRGCSHCHGMYHFALLRIVILLALLGFVFWAGVCVGGFENGGDFGRHHRMMGEYEYGYDYPVGGNMMYYGVSTQAAVPAQTISVPAASAPTR